MGLFFVINYKKKELIMNKNYMQMFLKDNNIKLNNIFILNDDLVYMDNEYRIKNIVEDYWFCADLITTVLLGKYIINTNKNDIIDKIKKLPHIGYNCPSDFSLKNFCKVNQPITYEDCDKCWKLSIDNFKSI